MGCRLAFVWFLLTTVYFTSTLSAVVTEDSMVSVLVSIKKLQMTFDMLVTKVEKLETLLKVLQTREKEILAKLKQMVKQKEMQMMNLQESLPQNKDLLESASTAGNEFYATQ